MSMLTETIASWEEGPLFPEAEFSQQDVIATEARQHASPAWDTSIDALLQILNDASTVAAPQPNRVAIESALRWLSFLRDRFPEAPPTRITPEPDGGIIVERRVMLPDSRDVTCELTFYNNETAERTDYLDGKVQRMSSIPLRPVWRRA